jgi:hypothetical protein
MASTIRQAAARARSLWYTLLGALFTLLFAVITVRFTLGGVAFESFLLAALTFALAFQTRRWYRRFRAAGRDGVAASGPHDHEA